MERVVACTAKWAPKASLSQLTYLQAAQSACTHGIVKGGSLVDIMQDLHIIIISLN